MTPDASFRAGSRGQSVSVCSPSTLGYEIVASDFIDRSQLESIQTIDDLRANTITVVGQGMTQAMIFSPLGAAAAGLGIIVSLIASNKGGRGSSIVSSSIQHSLWSSVLKLCEGCGHFHSHHGRVLMDRFRSQRRHQCKGQESD